MKEKDSQIQDSLRSIFNEDRSEQKRIETIRNIDNSIYRDFLHILFIMIIILSVIRFLLLVYMTFEKSNIMVSCPGFAV